MSGAALQGCAFPCQCSSISSSWQLLANVPLERALKRKGPSRNEPINLLVVAVAAQHGWQLVQENTPAPAGCWLLSCASVGPCLRWGSPQTLPCPRGLIPIPCPGSTRPRTHLVGHPSALVILSAVRPSVMVMLLLLMCPPFWAAGLWGAPCLPLASP